MLENCKSAQERWGGVSHLIDQWLQERQDMLVRFCSLGDIRTFNSDDLSHRHKVKAFCEILVDYTSAGHFEIYDQLVREGKDFRDGDALHTANQLLKTIDATTERILDFNDKYLETDDLSSLGVDLSSLGESLSARMEAEDMMIEVLHTSHQDKLAP
ncbi:sigma D regulator [Porticoccus litoralis]|jgi:regulator of sigma D|uniref:Sigma D regulator n=1 Tax=Porticoccus litoralis TaxID=434086 RepID=A0AAW8B2Q1_9GAMM|nr:sigma D regulator [Porticoccus litoralis]MDP1520682.1 sigma D regulator [Porticoccus litoralis]TNE93675.1 MAG: sigma D regulator [Gammaproteobacteria bacterium]